MTWLSWRQARLELLIGGAALVIVALFLLWTGLEMASAYRKAELPACAAAATLDDDCLTAAGDFLDRFRNLDNITAWLNLLPFLVGLLLAAPAVLDLEQGTYRLAWTQGVTRRRWLAAKIGFGLALAAGVSAALVALWTWWRGPFDAIEGRFNGNSFDFEGTVTFGYVVFAFALCLTLGTLLRRTIPMVGIGLVLFLVTRIGVMEQLRPRYLAPVERTWDMTTPAPAVDQRPFFGVGNWVFDQGLVDAAGNHLARGNSDVRSCMAETQSKVGVVIDSCLQDRGFLHTIIYHPADRFWTFQAIETALYLGVAAGLLGITFWWITRRMA